MEIPEFRKKFIELNKFLNERSKFKQLVFTNGCFDVIHLGHIRYLYEARNLGDALVLGLDSDESVKKLNKAGPPRPIFPLQVRAEVLSCFSFVDYIISFEDGNPLTLIEKIVPDVLVKGGDWEEDKIIGSSFVKSRGGRVVTIPFVQGFSTTKILTSMEKK